jgi:hypothetical protein
VGIGLPETQKLLSSISDRRYLVFYSDIRYNLVKLKSSYSDTGLHTILTFKPISISEYSNIGESNIRNIKKFVYVHVLVVFRYVQVHDYVNVHVHFHVLVHLHVA